MPEAQSYIERTVQYLSQLVGSTISGICVDNSDPTEILAGLELSGRTDIAWIMADSEGNGPGYLHVVDSESREEVEGVDSHATSSGDSPAPQNVLPLWKPGTPQAEEALKTLGVTLAPEPPPEPEAPTYHPEIPDTPENSLAQYQWEKILKAPDPAPELYHQLQGPIRQKTSRERAAHIRQLLRDLGLRGISVRKGRGTASRYVDITLPYVRHEHPPGVNSKDCSLCSLKFRAHQRLEQLILAAYPDLDDRSDYHTDYFDFVFSIQ